MTRYIYRGRETNLGRFGHVKPGDVLNLTDQEAGTVEENTEFEPYVIGKSKEKSNLMEITDGMTPQQREMAEAHNKGERERQGQLEKANDEKRTFVQELGSMNFDQLRGEADRINKKHKKDIIKVRPDSSRGELFRAVLAHHFPKNRGTENGPAKQSEENAEKE